MNPNNQQRPTMPQQQQPFNPTHNHMYETLRKYLMQLHAQGLPGIDQVIHALNKAHVDQMKNQSQSPTMPQQQGQGGGSFGVYNQGGVSSIGGRTPSIGGNYAGGTIGLDNGMPFGSANINGQSIGQFGPQGY